MKHPEKNHRDTRAAAGTIGRFARMLIPCALILATPCANAASEEAAAKPSAKPNVLFIAVDDMRCDLGCYGVPAVISPNIDRLAASGVQFDGAYCQQAVCNPSRVSLMTGMRPDKTKVWDLPTDFRKKIPDAVTIPQQFRKNGYKARSFGKIFHNIFPDNISWDVPNFEPHLKDGMGYSDEEIDALKDFKENMKKEGKTKNQINRVRGPSVSVQDRPENEFLDGETTTAAIETMRKQAKAGAPFFLAVGFIRPHLPFIVPRKYWDMYKPQDIALAKNQYLPVGAPGVAFGDGSMGGLYELRDYMDCAKIPSPFTASIPEGKQRDLKRGYYASISHIDAQVGRLLAELKASGLEENTIVILWSDHGWKLGEHNGWCKQTNFEIDTRAPMIIRAPHAKGNGRHSASLVEFVDIYPTLCDLCGIPTPAGLDGVSMKPLLEDPAARTKDFAISQYPRTHKGGKYMGYTLRTARYRYVEWIDWNTGAVAERELYDHEGDNDENKNIAAEPANKATLEALSEKLWKTIPKPVFPQEKAFPRM